MSLDVGFLTATLVFLYFLTKKFVVMLDFKPWQTEH